jgi:hypothetical protein
MNRSLIAMLLLLGAVPQTEARKPLPHDPFQRCATKALRGDYGKLQAWQREGYRRGLQQGVTARSLIFLTAYYGTEVGGRIDRRDQRCTLKHAAANRVPQGHYVWTKFGLRKVLESGAHSNDAYAREKGAAFWIDYWYARARHCPFGGSTYTHVAVIR